MVGGYPPSGPLLVMGVGHSLLPHNTLVLWPKVLGSIPSVHSPPVGPLEEVVCEVSDTVGPVEEGFKPVCYGSKGVGPKRTAL